MLYCVSIIFAISMLSAYGVLQFRPTITNVLIAEGSTQMLPLGMFAFTIIGMIIFLVYANAIYMKYKMEETGVFLSLGLKQQAVSKMLNKEFCLLFGGSALIGILLSIPIAYLCWSLLTIFLQTAETAFHIGWNGLLCDMLFIIFLWVLLEYSNYRTVKQMDIIKILKISKENEEVKFSVPKLGVIGFICIPVGFILFNICETSEGFLRKISLLFLILSLIGLYLFTTEITAMGSLFKKLSLRIYLKNLLFFNPIKQKGKQYTLALFVSTILIAITIFGL